MKTIFALFAILISTSASAETFKTDCSFEDFQYLNNFLESSALVGTSSQEDLNKVQSLLIAEFAPQCEVVVYTDMITIPGDRVSTYEITDSASQTPVVYSITLVDSMEMETRTSHIEKN